MSYTTLDRAITILARRQHGAFSRRQAVALGATAKMIQTRVRSGQWRIVDHGVYALPSHPSTWHQRVMAATLGNEGAVASGKTAAALYGIQGFARGGVEITVPAGAAHSSRIAIVRRSDHVRRRLVDGIPVNAAHYTWFDLLGSMTPDGAEAALEDAMRKRLVRFDELSNHFVTWQARRRPGVATARRLIEARDTGYVPSASELERLLYAAFDVIEFQPYERQAGFPWRPTSNERLDGLVVAGGVITEADGRSWHEQLGDMANDRRRDREAITNGYLPTRWMWTELRDDWDLARATVRAILARNNADAVA
jgi:hypothetical protein